MKIKPSTLRHILGTSYWLRDRLRQNHFLDFEETEINFKQNYNQFWVIGKYFESGEKVVKFEIINGHIKNIRLYKVGLFRLNDTSDFNFISEMVKFQMSLFDKNQHESNEMKNKFREDFINNKKGAIIF